MSIPAIALAQTIGPSNSSQDLYPVDSSPRFLLNGTEFPDMPAIRLAPVGPYAQIQHSTFVQIDVLGHLLNVDASNANSIPPQVFSFISCDPEDYSGNLDATDVFKIVVNSPRADIIILYSERSGHCYASGLSRFQQINGILTTVDPMVASSLARLNLNTNSTGTCQILPDLNSYTNSSSSGWGGGASSLSGSPTTAVAMIILYSITGIITALFVVIIVTGAVRAHRHPERYGPRMIMGRGRQSRARGIARAMLETLPIVKFGDREEQALKPAVSEDIEMNAAKTTPHDTTTAHDKSLPSSTTETHQGQPEAGTGAVTDATTQSAFSRPDGTDEDGTLQCSICTEDFTIGEEVRVLPCNHKFHPACVDPWLLNVSGTCPLCRIDLRPKNEQGEPIDDAENQNAEPSLLAPIGNQTGQGGTMPFQLRNAARGTREERLMALRWLRADMQRRALEAPAPGQNEHDRGLARRFRERFRIRTERRGTVADAPASQQQGQQQQQQQQQQPNSGAGPIGAGTSSS